MAISACEEQRMRAKVQHTAVMKISDYYSVHVRQDGNILQTVRTCIHEANS